MAGTEGRAILVGDGARGSLEGQTAGPSGSSLLFSVSKGEAAKGLGLRSHSLPCTSGKDRVGHCLRRSRLTGQEASVVTRVKNGSV